MKLKSAWEESEEVRKLRNQIEELKKKRTGYDTPEERKLEAEIEKFQRQLIEAESAERQKLREERAKKEGKKVYSKEEIEQKRKEDIKKFVEASKSKEPEHTGSITVFNRRLDKFALPKPAEFKGKYMAKFNVTYEIDGLSLRVRYSNSEPNKLWATSQVSEELHIGKIETDEYGLPLRIYAGYDNRVYYDITVDTSNIPEGLKKLFADQYMKELAFKLEQLQIEVLELTKCLNETSELNQQLKEENEQLKAKVAEFEEREKKRIINRFKSFIS